MEGKDSEKNEQNIDTITFIDILAVLLRWRFVVIVVTIIGVVFGAVYFWLLPNAKVITIERDPGFVAVLRVNAPGVPGQLKEYFDPSVNSVVKSYFESIAIVTPVFKEVIASNNPEYANANFELRGELESYIRNNIIDKRLKIESDRNSMILTVTYNGKDADRAILFLDALDKSVRKRLTADLQPRIKLARDALEATSRALNASNPGGDEGRVLALSQVQQQRFIIDQMENDPNFAYQRLGDIVVVKADIVKDNLGKGLSANTGFVIAVVVAFFVSVILAFFLEYIRRTRSDPKAMNTLKSAFK